MSEIIYILIVSLVIFFIYLLILFKKQKSNIITQEDNVPPKGKPINICTQREEVQKLLDAIIEQVQEKADEQGLILITDDSHDFAYFDLQKTIPAIYNILDNAIRFTNSGRCIMIKAMPYDRFIRIDIMDEGIGIEQDKQDKILAQFRNLGTSNDNNTGLGLHSANEIITSQGGHIEFSSKVNEGTTFSVFLPKNP